MNFLKKIWSYLVIAPFLFHTGSNLESSEIETSNVFQNKQTRSSYLKVASYHGFQIGEIATDFSISSTNNNLLKMCDVAQDNKLTLILFWASWSHKSDIEMPTINRVYDKYKQNGFQVIAISLDQNKTAWEKKISKTNSNWIHGCEAKSWHSDLINEYKITTVPSMLLVDEEGIVVLTPYELKRAHMLETWMNENYK